MQHEGVAHGGPARNPGRSLHLAMLPWQLAADQRLLRACRWSKAPEQGCTLCRSPGGEYRVENVICLRQASLLLHWGQRSALLQDEEGSSRSDTGTDLLAGTGKPSRLQDPCRQRCASRTCAQCETSQQHPSPQTCLHLPPV